jgi:Sigma-70, region 4
MQRSEAWNAPERRDPDELNAARVRLLIADALGQLSADHRALIGRSYYLGWTTVQIADDLHIAERFAKSRLHVALRALQRTLEPAARCAGEDLQIGAGSGSSPLSSTIRLHAWSRLGGLGVGLRRPE